MTPRQTYVFHKTVHAIGGISVVYLGHVLGLPKSGLAFAWALGAAKELYDSKHGGSFRVGDIAWTGMPATVLAILMRWLSV